MYWLPFWPRLLILIVAMTAIAIIERRQRGSAAARWHEYLALLVAALIGAMVVTITLNVTATISPEYFVVGKPGIPSEQGFRLAVSRMGVEIGMMFGALFGGVLLLATNSSAGSPRRRYAELASCAITIVLVAVVLAPVGGTLVWLTDPLGLSDWVGEAVAATRHRAFLFVWGAHAGAIIGGSAGTVWLAGRLRTRSPSNHRRRDGPINALPMDEAQSRGVRASEAATSRGPGTG